VLVQYLRKRKGPKSTKRKNYGPKRGVLVAVKLPEGSVGVGYSLCNLKLDKFDTVRGTDIALGRAFRDSVSRPVKLPQSVQEEYDRFVHRATKYFGKDAV
jgi:hypothetical protein